MIEEIYRKYFHDVFLYLKSVSHSDDISEELTQETFFRAMKSIDSFRGDCDVRVWLCQIAKNCYFTYCRKNRRSADWEEIPETEQDRTVSVEAEVEDRETAEKIRAILDGMKEPYREVFRLRVYGELSFRSIGEIFGKSENWAAVTYHRAKLKIIDKMEGLK